MERQIAIFSDIAYMQKEIGGPPELSIWTGNQTEKMVALFGYPFLFGFVSQSNHKKF